MSNAILSNLDTSTLANKGIKKFLRHPGTGLELPLWVKIFGADGNVVAGKDLDALDNHMKRIAETGKLTKSGAEIREERINKVCAAVSEWGGGWRREEDGEELPCTEENKKAIFGHLGYTWMLDQLDPWIRDRANFLPESKTE